MKQLLPILLSIIIVSCEKETVIRSRTVKLDELIGVWQQSEPFKVSFTDLETGITTEKYYQETFRLNTDNSFNLSGELFFRKSDTGKFHWDENTQELGFTGDPLVIEIGGNPTVFDANVQKWKWKIKSLENDSLSVSVFNFDDNTSSFVHSYDDTFIRN